MSLPDLATGGALVDVPRWGHPWHGAVRGGVLTLPNGDTRARSQPVGGRTLLFRGPGAQDSPPTADDIARGEHFRDYALLSGSQAQLYGVSLGARTWLASTGADVWRVRWQALPFKFDSTLTLNLTLTPFGELADPAPSATPQTLAVVLADTGQSGVPLPGLLDTDATRFLALQFEDARSDGRRAVFAIVQSADKITSELTNTALTLGFVELSLQWDGSAWSAALAVLYDRDTTLGTRSLAYGDPIVATRVCKQVEVPSDVHPDGLWRGMPAYNGSSTAQLTVTDRVIGVAYLSDLPTPYTLDIDYQAVLVADDEHRDPVLVRPDFPQQYGLSFTATRTTTAMVDYALRFGSHAIAAQASQVRQMVQSAQPDYSTDRFWRVSVDGTATDSGYLPLIRTSEVDALFGLTEQNSETEAACLAFPYSVNEIAADVDSIAYNPVDSIDWFSWRWPRLETSYLYANSGAQRYSATVAGLFCEFVAVTAAEAASLNMRIKGVIARAGSTATPAPGPAVESVSYGSDNPVTGEVAWAEAEEVCYV